MVHPITLKCHFFSPFSLCCNASTLTTWITSTWMQDSSRYRQYKSSIQIRHVTWRTIRTLDILDHKQAFFNPVFRPSFEYRTIWQPDTNLPFEYQTSPVFRWLLQLNICLFLANAHSFDQGRWRSIFLLSRYFRIRQVLHKTFLLWVCQWPLLCIRPFTRWYSSDDLNTGHKKV